MNEVNNPNLTPVPFFRGAGESEWTVGTSNKDDLKEEPRRGSIIVEHTVYQQKCLPEASLWEELLVLISVTVVSSFQRNASGRLK